MSKLVTELNFGGGPDGQVPEPHLIGRLPKEPYVNFVRDLGESDLEALRARRGNGASPPAKSLMRIHTSHHSLARCLASGMRPMQASLVTGYSPGRISALQRDPAFQALVADYQAEVKSASADLAERMADFSFDAIELLHERLQNEPEQFSVQTLLDVVKAFADRTGHGPNSQVNLKVATDYIDRPPRETMHEWEERRLREIEADSDSLGSPAGASDRGNNRRLVS